MTGWCYRIVKYRKDVEKVSEEKCCCEDHGEITGRAEYGDDEENEVPDGHGSMYKGKTSDVRPIQGYERGIVCPSCPIHGISAKSAYDGELVYELCEVFHEDKKILGFGEVFLNFETLEDLQESYKSMAEAFDHPIIEYRDEKFYENGEELEQGKLEGNNGNPTRLTGG
jgi:hypothetical protein